MESGSTSNSSRPPSNCRSSKKLGSVAVDETTKVQKSSDANRRRKIKLPKAGPRKKRVRITGKRKERLTS